MPLGVLMLDTRFARFVGDIGNPESYQQPVLFEVVRGAKTAPDVLVTAMQVAKRIKKVAVVAGVCHGFIGNRMLMPRQVEAMKLLLEGATPQQIDKVHVDFGMPMGPLRLIDEIGIDVTVDIAATLEKAYGRRDRAPEILQRMRESKLLGRKSGGGFYKYEGREQFPNESLAQWRRSGSAKNDVDLAQRLMFLMINEAARCIEEKVVELPEDADYGMILGTGFAPHRGGPLRFAEDFGLKKVDEAMGRLAQSDDKFEPCDILKKHARDGTRFYES